jgi:hypothetical protein
MHNSHIIYTNGLPHYSFKNTLSIPRIGPDFELTNVYYVYMPTKSNLFNLESQLIEI